MVGLCIVAVLLLSTCCCTSSENSVVELLLLVPWPDNRTHAGWDAGPDLEVGARVAVKQVNANSGILPDHNISLIVAGHEACGLSGADMGLQNLVKHGINANGNGIACVIGLYCSTSTSAISKVAGHTGIDLIQLTASNSPIFNANRKSFPHLWHFLESASVYATMMTSIMDKFSWTRVAVVSDLNNAFNLGIANAFITNIKQSAEKELVYQGFLFETSDNLIEEAIGNIRNSGVFVIFLTMSSAQAAKFFCTAAQFNMLWPNYVWVVADYLVSFILNNRADFCSESELSTALEGSIMTYFSLVPNDRSIVLSSNVTYQEYTAEYSKELNNVEGTTPSGEYTYAAAAYDQVWAFSKALHQAIPKLQQNNLSIEHYGFGQPKITSILENELMNLNFRGATGQIQFNKNREVATAIKIYQVRNKTEHEIGQFDVRNNGNFNITLTNLPSDKVTPQELLLPLSLFCVLLIASIATLVVVSINFTMMICLRNHSEIKAASPFLSSLIFLGCYMECISAIVSIVKVAVSGIPILALTVMCNVELCIGFMGLNLILVTMTMRLARIFRIFTHFGKTGTFWRDKSLFFVIITICSYVIAVFVLWLILDTLTYENEVIYHTEVYPVYAELKGKCTSVYYFSIWFLFLYIVVILLMMVLIFFAIQTRSISRKDFKDTKKVVLFSFAIAILITLFTATWVLLQANKIYEYASATLSMMFLGICILSQTILFMPRLYPTAFNVIHKGESPEVSRNIHHSITVYESPHTFTKTIRSYSSRSSILFKQFSQAKLVF